MPSQQVEYPDPVIRAFMERVRMLPSDAVQQLNFMRPVPWHVLVWRPALLFWPIRARILAWSVEVMLTDVTDEAARRAYEDFIRELRHEGWTPMGRVAIVTALTALRARKRTPARSFTLYNRAVPMITASSIGWDELDTA